MTNGSSAPSLKKGSIKYVGWFTSKNRTVAWREALHPREKDPKAESRASLTSPSETAARVALLLNPQYCQVAFSKDVCESGRW